jgi:hypothetical protein
MRSFNYKISIDGQEFDTLGLNDKLISLEFRQNFNKIDLLIIDLWNEGYNLTDSNIFRERANLSVSIGNGGILAFLDTFILQIPKFKFNEKDVPIIRLIAFNEASLLKEKGEKRKSFLNMTDSEIVQQVSTENALLTDISTTTLRRTQEVQLNETDISFVERLAKRNAFLFYIENKTLHFHPIRYTKSLEDMGYREDAENELMEFYPQKILLNRGANFISTFFDKLTGVQGSSRSVGTPDVINVQDASFYPAYRNLSQILSLRPTKYIEPIELAANNIAHQNLVDVSQQRNDYLISAIGKCTLFPALRIRQTVTINNIGHLSGNYYIKSLIHKYTTQQASATYFEAIKSRIGNLKPIPNIGSQIPNSISNPAIEIQPDIIGVSIE